MDNREKFKDWFLDNYEPNEPCDTYGYCVIQDAWQACAESKQAELEQDLKELTDHINKVWADTYPDAVPADTMLALKNRIKNLAEDRACWVFNARVLQNKLNSLEIK